MTKSSNFAHNLPLFYALKMLFRMSTFIYNNSMIRNLAGSWVASPDGPKYEPSCSYKVYSYKKVYLILQMYKLYHGGGRRSAGTSLLCWHFPIFWVPSAKTRLVKNIRLSLFEKSPPNTKQTNKSVANEHFHWFFTLSSFFMTSDFHPAATI